MVNVDFLLPEKVVDSSKELDFPARPENQIRVVVQVPAHVTLIVDVCSFHALFEFCERCVIMRLDLFQEQLDVYKRQTLYPCSFA